MKTKLFFLLEEVYYSLDSVKEDNNVGTVPTARMMDFLSLTTEPGIPPHAL